MFPHHFHRWFCAGEHLFRSQKKTRSGSKIQKVGKRNGAAKETTKEPSPNSKRRKSLQSDSFSCKVFPAEKPCTEDFSTCKVFPYSVLNKGYLLNQKAIGEKLALSGPALDPFHTGGWTGKSPYFFDFWYCRTNSVRSKSKVGRFSGENPYSKLGLLASCKTRTCQKSGFYPEFEDSREVQLGSLAAIGFLLQIRDLLGDIDRFERSVRFKFSRSV
mgnify:CR=1 FL=1